jgi:hypothetical protein
VRFRELLEHLGDLADLAEWEGFLDFADRLRALERSLRRSPGRFALRLRDGPAAERADWPIDP